MKDKVWVAKVSDNLGKLHDFELSPRFESIYDCQEYIDKDLKSIEDFLSIAFCKILNGNFYIKGKRQYKICLSGRFIRCYHVRQKRFCTGFDF